MKFRPSACVYVCECVSVCMCVFVRTVKRFLYIDLVEATQYVDSYPIQNSPKQVIAGPPKWFLQWYIRALIQ